jgi:hypothetical protein
MRKFAIGSAQLKQSDVREYIGKLFLGEQLADGVNFVENAGDHFAWKGSTVVYDSPPAQDDAVTRAEHVAECC